MAAPIIDSLENVPTVGSVVAWYTHHAQLGGNGITDGAGNRFRAAQFNFAQSNNSRVYVQKIAPDGVTILGHWQIAMVHNIKHDDFGLDYSGNDLIVWSAGHAVDAERLSQLCEARIVGVFENPAALAGTRGGASTPTPVQEGEVDPQAVVDAFARALSGNTPLTQALYRVLAAAMIDTLYSEEADAVIVDEGELNARVQQAFAGGGDFYKGHGPYARFNETLWEQMHKVLDERGLGTPPPPKQPNGEPFPPMPDSEGRNGGDE